MDKEIREQVLALLREEPCLPHSDVAQRIAGVTRGELNALRAELRSQLALEFDERVRVFLLTNPKARRKNVVFNCGGSGVKSAYSRASAIANAMGAELILD
jgi:hypothetical protein